MTDAVCERACTVRCVRVCRSSATGDNNHLQTESYNKSIAVDPPGHPVQIYHSTFRTYRNVQLYSCQGIMGLGHIVRAITIRYMGTYWGSTGLLGGLWDLYTYTRGHYGTYNRVHIICIIIYIYPCIHIIWTLI